EGECFNVNSFNLDAQGFFGTDATFSWDFGAVGFPSTSDLEQPQGVIFNVPGAQNVTLVVEDNGCLSVPFIGTIDVYEMPVAAFEADVTEGCEMLPVNFQDLSYNGNSNLYCLWDMGNGSSATESDPGNVYSAGSYSVHLAIETTEGCADQLTRSNYLLVHEKPTALFSMSSQQLDILDPRVEVTNLAENVVSSEFTFYPFADVITAMQTTYTYPDTGRYSITQIVTTENDCKDTIIGELVVKPHFTFYIPNAFTPDENYLNEVWLPQGQSINIYELTIYDRWNEVIFFSADLETGWDGSYRGKQVQQGTYFYKIDIVDVLGKTHKYRGTFHLLR
ncbi:MAG: gliding motility-associated C-terminal domain-containing protein, partial [Flavobacteriales bacterium]|nr:gliding motility-associated C-terminal domain-containing protein [Flavobacteriales bacterium]